jgi:Protein of unknown function (DUF3106)
MRLVRQLARLPVMLAVTLAASAGAGQQPPASTPSPPAKTNQLRNPHAAQHHAGDWLRKYKNMPPEQQQKALENDPDFRRLPAERQQKLRQSLQHFTTLPPQKQDRILQRMEIWEHLTPTQRQQARSVYARIRQLPPDRRNHLIEGIHNLQQMDPQQRKQYVDSDQFRTSYTDQERNILKGVLDLPLRPASKPETAPATPPASQATPQP